MRLPEKITELQLSLLILPLILATEMLYVPSFTSMFAMQNAWISVLISTFSGYWCGFVMIALAKRYPGMNTIQYSDQILGKWGGKLLALIFAYAFFIHVTVTGHEVVNFIKTIMLPTTPDIIVAVSFLIICGFSVYAGIEVLSRCGEFIFYFNLILFTLGSTLIFGDIDFSRIMPVFGEGYIGILKGAVVPSAWTSQAYVIGFLLPYLDQTKNIKRNFLFAMTSVGIIMVMTVLESVLVLGNLTPRLVYPLLEVIRYISIADFIERLDAVVASLWLFGAFLKESIFLFVLCTIVTELFGLNNYRDPLLPISIISTIGMTHAFINTAEGVHFLLYTYPIWAILVQTLTPTLLIVLDSVKKKFNTESG